MTTGSQIETRPPPGLLWIGNQVSGTRGTKGVSEHVIELLRTQGWRVYAASRHESRLLRLADMLLCAFKHRRQYAIGILDVYSGLAFRYAEILSAFLSRMGKPTVLALHGGGLVDFARNRPERLRRLLRRASHVVTPSHYLRSGLSGFRPDIAYLPNGIDCNQFAFRPRESFEPKLCWVRAFRKIYNPLMAVKCLAALRKQFPAASLRMVGPDPRDGTLDLVRVYAAEQGVRHALDIIGPLPHDKVPQALQKSDIFLNTTNSESFGVSAMEAAACGLCIVSTNVGELPLLWQDGDDALLVRPGDHQAMSVAVTRILSEPGLAERLSRNARAKAEQFDWHRILPQWEALLQDVAVKHDPSWV